MIYLASASPRRQELLQQLGVPFEALAADIHEQRHPGETPREYVRRVACDKARAVAKRVQEQELPRFPVLGADTEVVLDNEVFGKPRDRAHGVDMLRRLSGRTHEVLTALCLVADRQEYVAVNSTRVTIAPLAERDIQTYWDSGEPLGKAGAYAIQGKAAAFIARLEGSYSGVMGLPLYELSELLKEAGAT